MGSDICYLTVVSEQLRVLKILHSTHSLPLPPIDFSIPYKKTHPENRTRDVLQEQWRFAITNWIARLGVDVMVADDSIGNFGIENLVFADTQLSIPKSDSFARKLSVAFGSACARTIRTIYQSNEDGKRIVETLVLLHYGSGSYSEDQLLELAQKKVGVSRAIASRYVALVDLVNEKLGHDEIGNRRSREDLLEITMNSEGILRKLQAMKTSGFVAASQALMRSSGLNEPWDENRSYQFEPQKFDIREDPLRLVHGKPPRSLSVLLRSESESISVGKIEALERANAARGIGRQSDQEILICPVVPSGDKILGSPSKAILRITAMAFLELLEGSVNMLTGDEVVKQLRLDATYTEDAIEQIRLHDSLVGAVLGRTFNGSEPKMIQL